MVNEEKKKKTTKEKEKKIQVYVVKEGRNRLLSSA